MHQPVLLKEVLYHLNPKPNQNFIDCTLGEGGHAKAILEKIKPKGKLLGIERDPEMLERAKKNLAPYAHEITLVCGTYADLKSIAQQQGFTAVQGILFDLGVSLWHFQETHRGFSFQEESPLDMRLNPAEPFTVPASYVISHYDEKNLSEIFDQYGGERYGSFIARRIVSSRRHRPIRTARDLAVIVEEALGRKRGRIHPATRIFQALRIVVNDEFGNLQRGLEAVPEALNSGGRVAILSFHSGEEKIVKAYLKERIHAGVFSQVTKKPITPSLGEQRNNPRSRSAKLRVAEKR